MYVHARRLERVETEWMRIKTSTAHYCHILAPWENFSFVPCRREENFSLVSCRSWIRTNADLLLSQKDLGGPCFFFFYKRKGNINIKIMDNLKSFLIQSLLWGNQCVRHQNNVPYGQSFSAWSSGHESYRRKAHHTLQPMHPLSHLRICLPKFPWLHGSKLFPLMENTLA